MALTGLTNLQPNNIKVTGIATFDQTVGIAGTLTYEDVTNVDAVGLITARSGVSVSGGQVSVGAGTSLHSTGLDLGTGNITGHNLKSTGIITATTFSGSGASLTNLNASNIASGTVPSARLGSGTASSSTFLAGDSTFKTVTGTTINNNADNRIITGSGTANTLEGESTLTYDGTNLDLGDGKYVRLGASNDFQMWHNGGTGNTNIKQVTGHMYFYTGSDLNMHIKDGTSVDLYYANSKKFETVTGGIKVTGAYALAASSGNNPTIDNADGGNGNNMYFKTGGSLRLVVQSDGHVRPGSDNSFDLGTASDRWRNLYTTDLQLSNKGKTNDVDGTWGDWTLQEGEDKIFMINNRTGKKYSLKMEEE
jgi:hypothetical protein